MPDFDTPNLGLTKPQVGSSDGSWGGKLNGNMDKIDAGFAQAVRAPAGEQVAPLPPIKNRIGGNKVLGADPVTGAIVLRDNNANPGAPGGNVMSIGLFIVASEMSIPAGTSLVRTSGYSRLGVGVADYQADPVVNQDYVTAHPTSSFISLDGRGWRLVTGPVYATAMGAIPGASAAATAFQRALIAARDMPTPADVNNAIGVNSGVLIPPGTYSASDIDLSVYTAQNPSGTSSLIMRAEIPGTVEIIGTAGKKFATIDGRYESVDVDGIMWNGGSGFFDFTFTGQNVNRFVNFSRCMMFNHTGVAIQNNAIDAPYFYALQCYFGGMPGAFDIAWGGYIDGSGVERCIFDAATVNLKLGPRLSGNFHIIRNDFHKNRDDYTKLAAVWLEPNTEDNTGASAGTGAIISGNKFGNEMQLRYEAPLLFANALAQGSAPDRGPLMPDFNNPAGIFQGITIEGNAFNCKDIPGGNEGNDAPIGRCYTSDMRNFTWRNNKTDGPRWQRMIEFLCPANPYTLFRQQNWNVELDGNERYQFGITNRPIGRVKDHQGVAASPIVQQPSDVRADDEVILYDGADPTAVTKNGSATVVAGPVNRQNGNFGLVTFNAVTDSIVMPFAPIDMTGAPSWLSLDLAPVMDSTAALREVIVEVFNNNSRVVQEVVTINTAVRRAVKPVFYWEMPIVPGDTDPRYWNARLKPLIIVGNQKQFLYCNLVVNTGALPINPANLRTMGGTWNRSHLILGNTHLWVDDQNALRMKQGAPTGPRDGVLFTTTAPAQ